MTVETRFHRDRDGGFTIERWQDCEDIVEHNHMLRSQPQTWAGTFRHVAEVPCVVIEKIMNEHGVDLLKLPPEEMWKFVLRKIKQNDMECFLVAQGRL